MSIYRISRRPGIIAEGVDTVSNAEAYFDRALRLIPADVVAAYLAVRGFWMPRDSGHQAVDPLADSVLNWWLPIIGIFATFLFRMLGTSKTFAKFDDIQWKTVFISIIAFILWVFAIQNRVFNLHLDPRIAPSLLVLFTLLIPLFQKGD